MPGIVILDMVLSYIPVRVHYRKAFSLAGSRRPSSDSIGPLSPPLAATRPGWAILGNHPIAGCQVKVIAYLASLYILYDLFIWNINLRTQWSAAVPLPPHAVCSSHSLQQCRSRDIILYVLYVYSQMLHALYHLPTSHDINVCLYLRYYLTVIN